MLTPEEFLAEELAMGVNPDNEDFANLAKAAVTTVSDLEFKTVMDYGAGTGTYANAFQEAGYDVCAFDIWESHKNFMAQRFPDLTQISTPVTTDLMLFIEVAEHMTDEQIDELFSSIHPKLILFSSTSTPADNDEEWGHINLKPQTDWDNLFKGYGYTVFKQCDLPTEWSKIYTATR